jgi:hypothetical protein
MSRRAIALLLILPTGGAGALAKAEERGALRLQTAPPAASLATGPLDATLDFNARPAWQERLDWIGRHGLPFARLRDNRDSQLVVGMHPEGYFGVFLTPRRR